MGMDNEEVGRIADAVSAAVKAVLQGGTGDGGKTVPKYDTIVSNGRRYVELKADSVGTVIDELNGVFHPRGHDFLSCKICRSIFENKVRQMGYSVVIKKRPRPASKKRK